MQTLEASMKYEVDFDAIRKAHSIDETLSMLGITLQGDEHLRGPCPICKSTGQRSLSITRGKNLWRCFDCKKGGGTIELVANFYGVSIKDAAKKIQEHFAAVPVGMEPLTYLVHDHDAVLAHFTKEDAAALGIGFSPRGIMRGLVVIPIRLPNGALAGYVGLEPSTKIKAPKQWKL